jgi:plastocyanin
MRLARTSLTGVLALLVCLALAGCASSAAAGWTFAPPPVATPTPLVSAGPGGSAGPSASALASTTPGASGSAAPSGSAGASGGTADVTISALNIAFEQSSVDAPAGKAFTLLFDNKDASVQHDIWIKDASGTAVFQGAITTGVSQTIYNVPALPAGTYTFNCSIHTNMTGSMVVK